MPRILRSLQFIAPLFLALSAIILAGAWFTQLALGWPPCGLCLIQRMPHYAALAAGLPLIIVGLMMPEYRRYCWGSAGFVALLCYLVALYWAGFHSGVEWRLWDGLQSCGSGGTDGALSAADLLSAPVVDCSKPQLMLPGVVPNLTMANSHFLVVFGALVVAGLSLFRSSAPNQSKR